MQVEGACSSGGKISYVPQTAWCQNLTLKENIVFGQPWDEAHYKRVRQMGVAGPAWVACVLLHTRHSPSSTCRRRAS